MQKKLHQVAFLLDIDSIDSIRVVHSPPMEHPIRITLDTLARCGVEYALGLQRGAVELHSRDLAEALRSAAASPLAWSGDINWTLVLYDVNGKERIRIGLNESGKNG